MSFIGIEFSTDDVEEGTIALIHHSWLTPLKKEVWWPPYKTGVQFKKALSIGEKPKETWSICGIKRIFFSCDDLNKAYKQLIKYEECSDIQSFALEDINQIRKRQRKRNLKYVYSSSEEEDGKFHRSSKISIFVNKPEDESVTPRSKIISSCSAEKRVIHSDASVASAYISTNELENMDSQNQTAIPLSRVTVSTNTNTQSNSVNSTLIHQESNLCESPHSCNLTEKIFEEIKKMKEEIKEIYGLLKQSNIQNSIPSIPDDLTVKFPLETREELEVLEDYLNSRQNKNAMSSYFSTLGGDNTTAKTNKILKYVLTNELATGFNFAGQKSGKEAFVKLHLKNVIIRSVQIKSPSTTESDVEKAIKAWLKHAPDRVKENLKRKSREKL